MGSDTASAVSAVWRLEPARLVAALARMTHDLGLAEDSRMTPCSPPSSNGRPKACPATPVPG